MNNGNAWVTASDNVTVYWGYPEGTDQSTDFKLYHFKGLHRDGENSGFDLDDLDKATVESVSIDKDANGIFFTVESGSFSPFVLTWDTDARHTITATARAGGTITPSDSVTVAEGADQTFTITANQGYEIDDVKVDGQSVGAQTSYTFTNVTADHTISASFTRGNAPADPGDTGVDEWFDVTNHGAFLHGYADGSGLFGPDNNMTRAEAAQMFYNMLKDKAPGDIEITFPDVDEGAWYADAVGVLASHGIVRGDGLTGTFRPADPISRAEFMAIAMRFSKGDVSGENIFTDVREGDWFYDVVVGSVKYGWINGYQDGSGRFGPADTLTRADATAIANRMLGRVPDGVWIARHTDELKLFPDVPESHYAWRDIVEATNAHGYERDGIYEKWTGLTK